MPPFGQGTGEARVRADGCRAARHPGAGPAGVAAAPTGAALPEIVPGEAATLARRAPMRGPGGRAPGPTCRPSLTARGGGGRGAARRSTLTLPRSTFDMCLDLDRTAAALPRPLTPKPDLNARHARRNRRQPLPPWTSTACRARLPEACGRARRGGRDADGDGSAPDLRTAHGRAGHRRGACPRCSGGRPAPIR